MNNSKDYKYYYCYPVDWNDNEDENIWGNNSNEEEYNQHYGSEMKYKNNNSYNPNHCKCKEYYEENDDKHYNEHYESEKNNYCHNENEKYNEKYSYNHNQKYSQNQKNGYNNFSDKCYNNTNNNNNYNEKCYNNTNNNKGHKCCLCKLFKCFK